MRAGKAASQTDDGEYCVTTLTGALLQRLQTGGGGSQLCFQVFSLLRQRLYLKADLPDFLIAILKD